MPFSTSLRGRHATPRQGDLEVVDTPLVKHLKNRQEGPRRRILFLRATRFVSATLNTRSSENWEQMTDLFALDGHLLRIHRHHLYEEEKSVNLPVHPFSPSRQARTP
jgi:hypothetical protein